MKKIYTVYRGPGRRAIPCVEARNLISESDCFYTVESLWGARRERIRKNDKNTFLTEDEAKLACIKLLESQLEDVYSEKEELFYAINELKLEVHKKTFDAKGHLHLLGQDEVEYIDQHSFTADLRAEFGVESNYDVENRIKQAGIDTPDMTTDPEYSCFYAYWPNTEDGKEQALAFCDGLEKLIRGAL